jgi:hypothetical protein
MYVFITIYIQDLFISAKLEGNLTAVSVDEILVCHVSSCEHYEI